MAPFDVGGVWVKTPDTDQDNAFMLAFYGSFVSALRWNQLDELWIRLHAMADEGWFIYAVGEPPPQQASTAATLTNFIEEIDQLLRKEHHEDYCGIVFADDMHQPSFIKIYDPHHLGVSCGYSKNPPLPGWVLSKLPPRDLPSTRILPASRRRWWNRLFSN